MTDCTGEQTRDVFYYGNLVGDTGSTDLDLAVTPRDLALTRRAVGMRADYAAPPHGPQPRRPRERDRRRPDLRNMGASLARPPPCRHPHQCRTRPKRFVSATALVREERRG